MTTREQAEQRDFQGEGSRVVAELVSFLAEESERLHRLEAALQSLHHERAQIVRLVETWRDAAVWEHDDMGNTQSAQAFDQCADDLSTLLAGSVPREPRMKTDEQNDDDQKDAVTRAGSPAPIHGSRTAATD